MQPDPKDLATNVLYNDQAIAILEDACARLKALGLQCGYAPDCMFPESEMAVVLRVSTSARSIDETTVGSLLGSDYANSTVGRKHFDEMLADFLSDCVIAKAMNTPGAEGA